MFDELDRVERGSDLCCSQQWELRSTVSSLK
jgi:hypothetical protein